MNKHFTGIAFCFAVVASLLAAGCNDDDIGTEPRAAAEQSDLAAMVEALVSANQPPPIDSGPWPTESETWSREEDHRVRQAYDAIIAAGPAIIPYLIEAWDRTEYSTYDSGSLGGGYYKLSVGDRCRSALNYICDPIGAAPKVGPRQNSEGQGIHEVWFFDALPDKQAARDWWEQNSRKTARQLRRELYQWHVDREIQFGFTDDEQKAQVLAEIERRYQQSQQQ